LRRCGQNHKLIYKPEQLDHASFINFAAHQAALGLPQVPQTKRCSFLKERTKELSFLLPRLIKQPA